MVSDAAPTERLWLTEPRRKTNLAIVTATSGDLFRLDRSLYCPRSRTYRHPQEPDRGTVWTADGEKRRLQSVFERADGLWHRLRGAVPQVGDRLQCHLDVDRRAATARAHTGMHLALHTWPSEVGRLVADPEVRGGGHFRFTTDARWVPRQALARWVGEVAAQVRLDRTIERTYLPDDAVRHGIEGQPFADGAAYPGPTTTRACIRIAELGTLPCDGTHCARTSEVGEVKVQQAHVDRAGHLVVVFRATAP